MALTARPTFSRGRGVAAAVLASSLLLALLLYWQHDGSSDAGTTLTTAWQMSQGQRLYSDLVDFYPPGAFALLAGVFWLLGPSYLAARAVFLGLLLVAGFIVWRGVRTWLPGGWSLAVLHVWLVFFAFYPLINHNPLSLWLAFIAWVLFATALGRQGRGWAVAAGVIAGLASITLQTKGLAVLAAAALTVAVHDRRQWRMLVWLGLGFSAALVPLFLVWRPALLWELLVAMPSRYYGVATGRLEYGLLALVFGLHAAAGWQLVRQRAPMAVFGWWWLGAALLFSTVIRSDAHHVVMNSLPLALVTLWLLSQGRWRRTRGWRQVFDRLLVTTVATYPATVVVLTALALPTGLPTAQGKTWAEWLTLRNPGIEAIVFAVQTRVPPGKPIYAGPFLANAYFETQRHNPTRFNNLITGLYPRAFFAEARVSLEANPPAVALVNYPLVAKYRHQMNNPVDEFLWSRYRVTAQFGDVLLLELQQPPAVP